MNMRKSVWRLVNSGFLVLAILALGACGFRWTPVNRISWAVWSEDGQRVAYVRLKYEERMPILLLADTTEKRGFSYSLYHAAPDGSELVTIVQDRAGLAGEIWYMAAEGYILVYQYAESSDDARYVRFDLSDLSVSTVLVDEWVGANERVEVLPSATGDAFVRLLPTAWCPEAGDYRMDCSYSIEYLTGDSFPHEARVTFYDSATLEVLEQGATKDEEVVSFDDYVTGAFMSDGSYVVSDGTTAWSFAPGLAPLQLAETPGWDCMYPPTSSGTVNGQGQILTINESGQGFMVQAAIPGEDYSFGCDSGTAAPVAETF
ncbi:MAG: hypothetical protein ABIJ86_04625 [Spirochaetota bacterium]